MNLKLGVSLERFLFIDASFNGHLDVVQYLVDTHHCDPLCQDEKYQFTSLHSASQNGHLDVVRYFTTFYQCDPLVKNASNDTPLHLAALRR